MRAVAQTAASQARHRVVGAIDYFIRCLCRLARSHITTHTSHTIVASLDTLYTR